MFNLFIVLMFTFAVALILVFWISKHDRKMKESEIKRRNESPDEETVKLDFRQFTKICMDICEILKIDVDNVEQIDNDEVVIHAISQDPITKVQFLIVGFHIHSEAVIPVQKIMEISDQIISERISKGIIMTTGQVDPAVQSVPELAPMSFIEKNKFWELVKENKINY